MPGPTDRRIITKLATRGYNADREAVTLLAGVSDPDATITRAIETAPDDAFKITGEQVRALLNSESRDPPRESDTDPSVSPAETAAGATDGGAVTPVETEGGSSVETPNVPTETQGKRAPTDPEQRFIEILGDITDRSTGTGEYSDFVTVFRDRYEQLAGKLRGRINHRPANAIQSMPGGGAPVGLKTGS